MAESPRMDFGHFMDKIVWSLLIGFTGLILHSIGQLNKHMTSINDQTLILVERSTTYQKSLEDVGLRVQTLEAWRQAVMLQQAISEQQPVRRSPGTTLKRVVE